MGGMVSVWFAFHFVCRVVFSTMQFAMNAVRPWQSNRPMQRTFFVLPCPLERLSAKQKYG
jgi:hypothetical protein